jgi:hypothetical protein
MGPKMSGTGAPLGDRLTQIKGLTDEKFLEIESYYWTEQYPITALIAVQRVPVMQLIEDPEMGSYYDYTYDDFGNLVEKIDTILSPVSMELISIMGNGVQGFKQSASLATIQHMGITCLNANPIQKPAGSANILPIQMNLRSFSNSFLVSNDGGELMFNLSDNDWIYLTGWGRGFDFSLTARLLANNGYQDYIYLQSQTLINGVWQDNVLNGLDFSARSARQLISMSGTLAGNGTGGSKRFRFVLASESQNAVSLDMMSLNIRRID